MRMSRRRLPRKPLEPAKPASPPPPPAIDTGDAEADAVLHRMKPRPEFGMSGSFQVAYANPGCDGFGVSVQLVARPAAVRPGGGYQAGDEAEAVPAGAVGPDWVRDQARQRARLDEWLKGCGDILRRDARPVEVDQLGTVVASLPYNRALDPEACGAGEAAVAAALATIVRPTAEELGRLQRFFDVLLWLPGDSRKWVFARAVMGYGYRKLNSTFRIARTHMTVRTRYFQVLDTILAEARRRRLEIFS